MKTLSLLPLALIFSVSCNIDERPEGKIYAEINGISLTIEEAKANIPEQEFRRDSLTALEEYKERWIEDQIILQEVKRLKLLETPEVRQKVEKAKQDMLLISFQEAVLSSIEDQIQVSTEEVRSYYQENKDKFLLDERYIRFRHVIAENLTDAENAKRDLMRGYDWERVANEYSLQPAMVVSNSNRFWPESSALKEFDTLNRYLRVIGISEISLTENIDGKYHFVQLIEEKASGEHPDLEWLLEQIQEWLILEKKRVAYNTYVKNLYLAAQANNEIRTYNVLPKNTNTETTSDSLNSN